MFLTEWTKRKEYKTHTDIIHEIIRMCVSALHTHTHISSVAWKIIEDAVTDPTLPLDTLLLIFLPTWSPPLSTFPGQVSLVRLFTAPKVPVDEFSGAFAKLYHTLCTQESAIYFSEHGICERLRCVMKVLAKHPDEHIRIFALVKLFTFSDCMTGDLGELTIQSLQRVLIEKMTTADPHDPTEMCDAMFSFRLEDKHKYTFEVLALLYTSFTLQVLTKELQSFTHLERTSNAAHQKLCATHPHADLFRKTIATILDHLIHTPPLQIARRTRLLTVTRFLLGQMTVFGGVWVLYLVKVPFERQLAFLQSDAEVLKSILAL